MRVSVLPEVSTQMGSILPPKGDPKPKTRGSTVHLLDSEWDRLDEIAAESVGEDPAGEGYSRNEVIQHFLRWAMREYDAERRQKRRKAE